MAVDTLAADELDAEMEDIVGFFVDHGFGQAEFRDLRAHHAARFGILIEHGAVIAERRQIARDGQRGRPTADERDALAILDRSGPRQAALDVVLEIGGDALQPADRDRPPGRCVRAGRPAQHGRSQVRPRIPGNTLDFQLIM